MINSDNKWLDFYLPQYNYVYWEQDYHHPLISLNIIELFFQHSYAILSVSYFTVNFDWIPTLLLQSVELYTWLQVAETKDTAYIT